MKALIFLLVLVTLTNCASQTPKITRYNNPALRLFVNAEGIDSSNYVRLVHALKASNKYFILDREMAHKAIMKEQNLQHGKDHNMRFASAEKYAVIGKMFGAGGVIEARISCAPKMGFWGLYPVCVQNVNIYSTVTGELIHSAELEVEASRHDLYGRQEPIANWSAIVEDFNDSFPRNFEPVNYTPEMQDYRAYVAEEAVRTQEANYGF